MDELAYGKGSMNFSLVMPEKDAPMYTPVHMCSSITILVLWSKELMLFKSKPLKQVTVHHGLARKPGREKKHVLNGKSFPECSYN